MLASFFNCACGFALFIEVLQFCSPL
jgi:hypothetical protein